MKTIYVSGADRAYADIVRLLEAAGASPGDLLKITVYIPGYAEADLAASGAARTAHGFNAGVAPASTLRGIQSLYAADAHIEIEGIAVTRR